MIYALLALSLLFVAIGFLVTENNAKYLLSGYNTMSEAERKQVDIKSYILFFKKFHLFLGASNLIIGLFLFYLVSKNASGIFLCTYPILAYIYFIWTSGNYSQGPKTSWDKIGIVILTGVLVLVTMLIVWEFKEDKITIQSGEIEIEGDYGEVIAASDIESVNLIHQLPKISIKTNGFALGSVRKGHFNTSDGENVKLVLNSDQVPCILITKKSGEKIYFSAKEQSNQGIFEEMKKVLPIGASPAPHRD